MPATLSAATVADPDGTCQGRRACGTEGGWSLFCLRGASLPWRHGCNADVVTQIKIKIKIIIMILRIIIIVIIIVVIIIFSSSMSMSMNMRMRA